MPTFVPEEASAGPRLQGFAGDGFRVDGVAHAAVLLSPSLAIGWQPPALDALVIDDLRPLLGPRPELVLIGTGRTLRRPPAALVAALEADGIGIEAMDSRAAARAWVILRSEDRVAAAALYPLSAG